MNYLPNLDRAPSFGCKVSDYLLLTGATGLLGRYLMRDYLRAGYRVAVLVRSTASESGVERIESIMQMWEAQAGSPLPRPVVIEGDVCHPNLGVSEEDSAWIASHAVSLVHSAAVIRFDLDADSGDPFRTNVEGTRQALEFATRHGLNDFHYVSTAFVCGDREGLIREDELIEPGRFHNSYEQSKFAAEQLVRTAIQIPRRTVYRPSIITADSESGYTNTYFGIMWYLKLLAVLVPQQPLDEHGLRQTPIDLPVSGDEPHNLVPVNWVSETMVALFGKPESRGSTFHLCSPHSVTMRAVIDICYRYFGSHGVRFIGDQDPPAGGSADDNNRSVFARNFFESSRNYREYDRFTPGFDRSNLERLEAGPPCPPIDERVILGFLEFGRLDRWGKRRNHQARLGAATAVSALSELLKPTRESCLQGLVNGFTSGLGVDLLGPGGGQWRLLPDQSGAWQLKRGLGFEELPVKSLTVCELTQLAQL